MGANLNIQLSNDARSTLASAIGTGDLSLSVQPGEGLLFPSLAGTQYFKATLQLADGTREILLVTARATDDFTIERAQEGTVALAGAIGDLVQLRPTVGVLDELIDQKMTDYVEGTDAPTIIASNPRRVLLTPTTATSFNLPTDDIRKGQIYEVHNLATTAGYNITINSSGANFIWLTCPENHCTLMALQDAPTAAAHWLLLDRGWPIHARVNTASGQNNVTEGVATKVILTNVDKDPSSMFDNANDRLVLPVSGRWFVHGHFQINTSAVAADATLFMQGYIKLNGGGSYGLHETGMGNGSTTILLVGTATCSAYITVTAPGVDYIELFAYYLDSTDANLGDIQAAAVLSTHYLGP